MESDCDESDYVQPSEHSIDSDSDSVHSETSDEIAATPVTLNKERTVYAIKLTEQMANVYIINTVHATFVESLRNIELQNI